jgi:hypothetical protein
MDDDDRALERLGELFGDLDRDDDPRFVCAVCRQPFPPTDMKRSGHGRMVCLDCLETPRGRAEMKSPFDYIEDTYAPQSRHRRH